MSLGSGHGVRDAVGDDRELGQSDLPSGSGRQVLDNETVPGRRPRDHALQQDAEAPP